MVALPDEATKGEWLPSWDFRHGSGGQCLATTAAINGSPAMIQVPSAPPSYLTPRSAPAKKSTQGGKSAAARKASGARERLAQTLQTFTGAAAYDTVASYLGLAGRVEEVPAGDDTRGDENMPDEATKGVVVPSWDFRHGAGRSALATTAAMNGSPAMIEVH
eukprot:CAMPEP_0119297950 /NCGR_PEP_ID=MMETSP1333-20130426/141_1 /TAXON_ID=418940 /ORGANISM="Scyphosphaera apsteinii, Strain RCC1455" /LENGTH=161 /DNA_ID=CAMNT_0007298925 /DNA_START=109 /DNA_END=594 /DNA_ORIENTATION=+